MRYEQRCHGTCFVCDKCTTFYLCFKCYKSKEDLHPKHDFELFEPKFPPATNVEEKPQPNATEAVISTQDKMKELGIEDNLDDEVVSNDEDE